MNDNQPIIERCRQLDVNKRTNESINLLTEEISTSPAAYLYYERGLRFEAEGQYQSAMKDYSSAISLGPSAKYYLARGLLSSSRFNDDESAMSDYEDALSLESGDAIVYIYAAFSSLKLGRLKKAQEFAHLAMKKTPTDPLARSCLGQCLLASRQDSDAVVELQLAVSLDPSCAYNWSVLARGMQNLGMLSEAKACLQRAIEIDRSIGYMINYAGLLIESNELESAINILREISNERLTNIQKALVDGYTSLAGKINSKINPS